MILNTETYKQIADFVRHYHGLTKDCFKQLQSRHPQIDKESLQSIISLEYQKCMKHRYVKTPEAVDRYCKLYSEALGHSNRSGAIVRIAQSQNVAPCLVAKLILQRHLQQTCNTRQCEFNMSMVKTAMRDTSLIDDPILAYEVFLCTLYDDQYSPMVEMMKTSIGQQYEIRLNRQAAELKLAFRDETYLRKYGYDKTPDIKLEVPIVFNGFVVNWIESKALFGNAETHSEYVRNQYLPYWNRFGTGLVIYWFGYVDAITNEHENRFIIQDSLPTQFTCLSLSS